MKKMVAALRFTSRLCVSVLLVLTISSPALSEEDLAFDQGSVLVVCGEAASGVTLSFDDFNAGFPEWVTMLQEKANEGVIVRAHFLGSVREGVFFVVAGPDVDAALKNARDVVDALERAYREGTGKENQDVCKYHAIGPVAVLPR